MKKGIDIIAHFDTEDFKEFMKELISRKAETLTIYSNGTITYLINHGEYELGE